MTDFKADDAHPAQEGFAAILANADGEAKTASDMEQFVNELATVAENFGFKLKTWGTATAVRRFHASELAHRAWDQAQKIIQADDGDVHTMLGVDSGRIPSWEMVEDRLLDKGISCIGPDSKGWCLMHGGHTERCRAFKERMDQCARCGITRDMAGISCRDHDGHKWMR